MQVSRAKLKLKTKICLYWMKTQEIMFSSISSNFSLINCDNFCLLIGKCKVLPNTLQGVQKVPCLHNDQILGPLYCRLSRRGHPFHPSLNMLMCIIIVLLLLHNYNYCTICMWYLLKLLALLNLDIKIRLT